MKNITKFTWLIPLSMIAAQAVAVPGMPGPGGYGQQRAPAARIERRPGPEAVIQSGMENLIDYLSRKPRPTKMDLAVYLKEKVAPGFDFERMARAAMGRAYRALSPQGRKALVDRLEQDFLGVMARHLARFDGQRIRYFRPRWMGPNRARVTIGLAGSGKRYPARLDFLMYRGRDGWKVYDLAANGQSAVSHYRRKLAMWASAGRYGRAMPAYDRPVAWRR